MLEMIMAAHNLNFKENKFCVPNGIELTFYTNIKYNIVCYGLHKSSYFNFNNYILRIDLV